MMFVRGRPVEDVGLGVLAGILLVLGVSLALAHVFSHAPTARATPFVLPHPAVAWHFLPLHTASDQVILIISNANAVAARVQVRRGGHGGPITIVRVPPRAEAEMDLPHGDRSAITIRASMPILPERMVIENGRTYPAFGLVSAGQ